MEQATPEQVLKKINQSYQRPNMYVPSLHYLLLIDEGKLKPFDEVVQLEYTTKCDGMFRLQKCIALLSIKAKYVGNR